MFGGLLQSPSFRASPPSKGEGGSDGTGETSPEHSGMAGAAPNSAPGRSNAPLIGSLASDANAASSPQGARSNAAPVPSSGAETVELSAVSAQSCPDEAHHMPMAAPSGSSSGAKRPSWGGVSTVSPPPGQQQQPSTSSAPSAGAAGDPSGRSETESQSLRSDGSPEGSRATQAEQGGSMRTSKWLRIGGCLRASRVGDSEPQASDGADGGKENKREKRLSGSFAAAAARITSGSSKGSEEGGGKRNCSFVGAAANVLSAPSRRSCGGDGPNMSSRRRSTWGQSGHILPKKEKEPPMQSGKSASLHVEPSGEVVAINRRSSSKLSQIVPRLLRLQPMAVFLLGALFYASVALTFACLYFVTGSACFDLVDADFAFLEMLWLSVHTFSSVGFGSVYPTCSAGQLLVLLESYCALLVQAVVGAYVVFVFMRSRAKVRFSKLCLITRVRVPDHSTDLLDLASELDEASSFSTSPHKSHKHGSDVGGEKTEWQVTFRCVRESFTQIRDARIYVQARFSVPLESDAAANAPGEESIRPECLGGSLASQLSSQQPSPPSSPPADGSDSDGSAAPAAQPRRGSFLNGGGMAGGMSAVLRRGSSINGLTGENARARFNMRTFSLRRGSMTSNRSSGHSGAPATEWRPPALDRCAELKLEDEQISTLEHWHVVHRVSKASPLWPIRFELSQHLKAIDVAITAYDPAFNQPVKLYTRYAKIKDEIKYGFHFEPMDSTNGDGSVITVDHAKLDAHEQDKVEEITPQPTRQRRHSAGAAKHIMTSLRPFRRRMSNEANPLGAERADSQRGQKPSGSASRWCSRLQSGTDKPSGPSSSRSTTSNHAKPRRVSGLRLDSGRNRRRSSTNGGGIGSAEIPSLSHSKAPESRPSIGSRDSRDSRGRVISCAC